MATKSSKKPISIVDGVATLEFLARKSRNTVKKCKNQVAELTSDDLLNACAPSDDDIEKERWKLLKKKRDYEKCMQYIGEYPLTTFGDTGEMDISVLGFDIGDK
jgi:hypothetical protein